MPLNKPIKGAVNWDVTLNEALDYLDDKIDNLPPGPTGPAGVSDIADFTFTNNGDYELGGEVNAESEISLHNKDFTILTTRDVLTQEEIDQFGSIDADINITAADDVFIRAEGDDVSIAASNDVTIRTDDNNASYTWDFNSDGTFYLPAGTDIVDGFEVVDVQGSRSIAAEVDYLGNSPTNNSTGVYLTLDQDSTWMSYNFANKVTSTITFGDSSTVDLIAIYEADQSGTTVVVFQWETSRDIVWPVLIEQTATEPETRRSLTLNVPLTTDAGVENSAWTFSSDGSLTIPGSGRIVHNTGDIILNADGGEYIGNANSNENRIATRGEVGIETDFTVAGGTDGTQPTFDGDPQFTGSFIRNYGGLVHFRINVDMNNITNFGTGQYYVDLPFPAKYGYQFRDGCLHDFSTGKEYAIGGHVVAGSSTLNLTSTDTQSGAVFDIDFTPTAPVTLSTEDNFHIAGTYIAD